MERWLARLRRRWLLVALLLTAVVLVAVRFGEVERLAGTLAQGRWEWVLAAALLQVAYYLMYAGVYRLAFAAVGVDSRVDELVPVMFASIFVTTVVPSGGASAMALFVADAARRGQSGARAAEGTLLVLVADLVTMVPIIALGLAALAQAGVFAAYQAVGTALFLITVVGLTGALFLGRWLPRVLCALLKWVRAAGNGLAALVGQPPFLAADWPDRQAGDFRAAASSMGRNLPIVGYTLALAFAAKLVNLAGLYAVSVALRWPLTVGVLLAAFTVDAVFSVVSLIPQGLGTAEAVMVLALVSLGVEGLQAAAITVAFRGLDAWLPLLVGFLLLRRVRSLGGE